MSDVYLRKIELCNFRVYGDTFTLELPPEPGITLISGANGVGKTTLFDGIEWALTGDVSRFADYLGDGRRKQRDPLTRLGAPENSHRVSLHFTKRHPIDRGLGVSPEEREIIDFLKRPLWPEIDNLYRYLSITHFLGQAAAQRFSVKKPRDQWEALKGPAGVDRLNQVKDRIGGHATRLAFTRAIQRATDLLSAAEKELDLWTELVAERDRLSQLSSSEEALLPAMALRMAAEIAQQLTALTPQSSWVDIVSLEPPEPVFERLASLNAQAQEQARADGERLGTLHSLAVEFETLRTEIRSVTVLVERTELSHSLAVEALAEAEHSAGEAVDALPVAQRSNEDAQARVALLARVAAAADQLVRAEGELAEIDTQITASDAAVVDLQARQRQLSVEATAASQRLDQRRTASANVERARLRLSVATRLRGVEAEIARFAASASPEEVETMRQERADALGRRRDLAATVAATQSDLARLDERLSAMAEAVAAIVARLRPEDTTCPVCASRFAAGELLAFARSARVGEDPIAEQLGQRLAEQRLALEDLERQIESLERGLADHDRQLVALSTQRAIEADLHQEWVDAGGAPDSAPDPRTAAAQLETLETVLAQLDAALSAGPTLEDLQGRLAEVEVDVQAEAAKRAALMRRRGDLLAQVETTRSVLHQQPDLWIADRGVIGDLAAVRTAAADQSAARGTALVEAEARAEAARQRRDSARLGLAGETAALETYQTRLNNLVRRQQALTANWLQFGLSGEPDPERLAPRRAALADRKAQLEQLDTRRHRTVEGYRRWLQDEELRIRQQRIEERLAQARAESELVMAKQLRSAVIIAQRHLSAAQQTRAHVDQIVSRIQEQADVYAEQVLQPLNETIQRFGRALMTWADASIFYRAEHYASRSELRSGVVRTGPEGDKSYLEVNPNLFFSEGQLSALSVSALLAASTTFQWSRWRALLMDDPLQHNDVIHASAFIDLLRQLVLRLNYQVVLSTHDNAEAAFLTRKCESANIPFRAFELYPHGDEGLVSQAA
jgi:DNA repair exonuclease SbcCD ATPase subunit